MGAALAAPSGASAIIYNHHPTTPQSTCTQTSGRWAERTASAGVATTPDAGADLTGDTINDLWVAQPFCDLGSNADQGRVYLLSGAAVATGGTASPILTIDSPAAAANQHFGFYISVIGNVGGANSKPDIAIGTDPGTGVPGKAWVFDGSDGSTLYQLSSGTASQNGDRFGSRIGRAGDINSDTVPDIIVGASNEDVGSNTDQGQAYIFSGSDGVLLRTLNIPSGDAVANAHFGLSVQGPGNVNGSGAEDQLVDASNFNLSLANQGRMYAFDGSSGSLLRSIDDPTPQANAYFGFQDVSPLSPGDLNADGKADIYGNGFQQTDNSVDRSGQAWVFDINTTPTTTLRTLRDPTPETGGQFGWSMSKTDYNGSTNDLYIGQAPHVGAYPNNQNGGTYVMDGSNGSLLKTLELPAACKQNGATNDNGPALGWTSATPGNIGGDSSPDYVAGAPFFKRGTNIDEGVLLSFISGQTATNNPC